MRPKSVYLPEEQNDFIFAVVGSPWELLALWLILINLAAFFVFGFDKLQAKRKEKKPQVGRVPERTLLLLAAVGGSAGALLGMKVWRHKTQHKKFQIGVPLILILQIAAFFGFQLYWRVLR